MRKITAEQRAQIVQYYLENDGATYKDIAKKVGVNHCTISKIIRAELQAGNGVKPDRRKKDTESPWMQYVTPLHKHKMQLEQKVEHKQAELDKARQELRDFTATIRQLMKENDT